MQKDTKNLELLYGEAKIIASKAQTKPGYVRTVLYRHRSGQNIYGKKARHIIRIYNRLKS
jgi:hypothetical protein